LLQRVTEEEQKQCIEIVGIGLFLHLAELIAVSSSKAIGATAFLSSFPVSVFYMYALGKFSKCSLPRTMQICTYIFYALSLTSYACPEHIKNESATKLLNSCLPTWLIAHDIVIYQTPNAPSR